MSGPVGCMTTHKSLLPTACGSCPFHGVQDFIEERSGRGRPMSRTPSAPGGGSSLLLGNVKFRQMAAPQHRRLQSVVCSLSLESQLESGAVAAASGVQQAFRNLDGGTGSQIYCSILNRRCFNSPRGAGAR